MSDPIQWAAKLPHVREVSLLRTADLAYWRARLERETLIPAERNGCAQIKLIAADSTFMGVPFREVSFSVVVLPPSSARQTEAAYLERAFNSVRFFAWCERTLFATPYDYGDVRVSTALPASIRLQQQGEVVFEAAMGGGDSSANRSPTRQGNEVWQGAIFLPNNRRAAGRPGKLFIASLSGHTNAYPFIPATDTLTIKPSSSLEVFQTLIDSHFVPSEWSIRTDAQHAKSKTYSRNQ